MHKNKYSGICLYYTAYMHLYMFTWHPHQANDRWLPVEPQHEVQRSGNADVWLAVAGADAHLQIRQAGMPQANADIKRFKAI